jgi:hypothetical protein
MAQNSNDTLTVNPGETVHSGAGNDTITIAPGNGTGQPQAVVDAGAGNDTVIDQANKGSLFPITVSLGSGDDTFISQHGHFGGTSVLTGGPGHDQFEFFDAQMAGEFFTITDFSGQDAIRLDYPTLPGTGSPAVTFTNHGNSTELDTNITGGVSLTLQGNFDVSQFHIADDGQGHEVITYGSGGDLLLS